MPRFDGRGSGPVRLVPAIHGSPGFSRGVAAQSCIRTDRGHRPTQSSIRPGPGRLSPHSTVPGRNPRRIRYGTAQNPMHPPAGSAQTPIRVAQSRMRIRAESDTKSRLNPLTKIMNSAPHIVFRTDSLKDSILIIFLLNAALVRSEEHTRFRRHTHGLKGISRIHPQAGAPGEKLAFRESGSGAPRTRCFRRRRVDVGCAARFLGPTHSGKAVPMLPSPIAFR